MKPLIDNIKQTVRKQISESEFSALLATIDERIKSNPEYDKDIVTIAELFAKIDRERIFDHLQNFEVPLTMIEKIFSYYDKNENTD